MKPEVSIPLIPAPALLAVWGFAAGCAEAPGGPADLFVADASTSDAAVLAAAALDAANLDAAPTVGAINRPDVDAGGLSTCMTRLAAHVFVLDAGDCENRPAAPCTVADDPRYQPPSERSDYLAYGLFQECAGGQGFYPVGITFNQQGCADKFYSLPWPAEDALLQCYLRALQMRRFPCDISCSQYFRLD